MPADATTVLAAATAAELAIAASRTLYTHSPAVVLVAEGDSASLTEAAATAVDLGIPLLLTPGGNGTSPANLPNPVNQTNPANQPSPSGAAGPGGAAGLDGTSGVALRAELGRLKPRTLVTVGDPATGWAQAGSPTPAGTPVAVVPVAGDATAAPDAAASLPRLTPAPPLDELLVLGLDQPASVAAAATARASGARVLLVGHADPRRDEDAIKALAGQPPARVLALGSAFAPAERLRRRIDTAATGTLLPGGGQVVFPGRRLVALYGHPGDTGLGSLGEQSVGAAIARARKVAAAYAALVDEPVIPTFEIIATVASSSAGADGNYSNESSIAHLRPWVDAAREAGVYVMLDLQPGRTDFLTQAKLYQELLAQPHVGLALDPEWRLKPNQRHLVQIGSVTAAEINATAAWLAALTREHKLPQKVLMLHQFRLDMISNRAGVDTGHDELSVVIHADGFGSPGQKYDTWNALHIGPPPNVWWGWKNFYDEDRPTFTPGQTIAVSPSPVFVSYQ